MSARKTSMLSGACLAALALVIAGGFSVPAAIAGAETAASQCNDVWWVDPDRPPAEFLIDVPEAPGTGDCQFHEFSSWNFLWLVQGSNPHMEGWPTSDMVFRPDGPPICNGVPLGSHLALSANKMMLSAKGSKQPAVLGEGPMGSFSVDQAFGGPLVDQNGRYVQYEMRLNPELCEAVQNCQLWNLECQLKASQLKDPKGNPAFRWDSGSEQADRVGATELKLAWRVMETCDLVDSPPKEQCKKDDLDQIFWISGASVAEYSPQFDEPVDDLTLGLIGFHLAQKTPEHPEMIWATWEHISNAPVCADAANATCGDPSRADSGVATKSGWALVDLSVAEEKPCQGFTGFAIDGGACCKPDDASGDPAACLNQDYYDPDDHSTQPVSQVCRQFACGVWKGSEPGSPGFPSNWREVSEDINDLNNAIRAKLGPNNVWWNYFLVGTLWGQDPQNPPKGVDGAAGSVLLANSTMETYYQGLLNEYGQKYGANGLNCFNCHKSTVSTKPISPALQKCPDSATADNCQVTNLDFIHSIVRATQKAPCAIPDKDLLTCVVPGAKP